MRIKRTINLKVEYLTDSEGIITVLDSDGKDYRSCATDWSGNKHAHIGSTIKYLLTVGEHRQDGILG